MYLGGFDLAHGHRPLCVHIHNSLRAKTRAFMLCKDSSTQAAMNKSQFMQL